MKQGDPEKYVCRYDDEDWLEVHRDSCGDIVVKTFLDCKYMKEDVILKPEDIHRLIAQLTAAKGDSVEQLPGNIRSVIDATVKASMLGFWNTPCDQDPTFEPYPKEIVAELADEDTMEVRIAVVAGWDEAGDSIFCAMAHRDWSDRESRRRALDGEEFAYTSSFVTARVPLPPKPEICEVNGEVEVSDG